MLRMRSSAASTELLTFTVVVPFEQGMEGSLLLRDNIHQIPLYFAILRKQRDTLAWEVRGQHAHPKNASSAVLFYLKYLPISCIETRPAHILSI